jgi:hypothetical protein
MNTNQKNNNKKNNKVEQFYIENNYEYFNDAEYYKFYNFKSNESELPEWYNTDLDNEIVTEIIDETSVLYDSSKSIETEMREYEVYRKQITPQNTEEIVTDSESEGEWTTI